MKILQICNNYIGSKLYIQLFENLMELGLNLQVYVPIKNKRYYNVNKIDDSKIRIHYSDIHGLLTMFWFTYKMWVSLKDINNKINFKDVNLIHAHTLFSDGGLALRIKRRYGIKYIVAVRDTDLNVFLKYGPHLINEANNILLESEKIIFLNIKYQDKLLSKYVKKKNLSKIREKCIVIPNGIDPFWIDNFQIKPIANNKEKLKILFAGQFLRRKNLHTILDVYDHFQSNGVPFELTLVGKDSFASRKIINRLSQDKYQPIKVIDKISNKKDMLNVYREHDAFFMPSYRETFGLVYLEALSQGLPVFYSKGQAIDGYFMNSYIGASCNANDVNGFCQAILNRRQPTITKSGFSIFNWGNIAEQYKSIYEANR